jgi:hypothetical protein
MLSDRGLFWWSDTPTPADQFAPEQGVSGLLTISETGRIKIELDGVLPNPLGRWAVMEQGAVKGGRSISGILMSENKHVLVTDVHRNGGRVQTNGLSRESFIALYCLISQQKIAPHHRFRALTFDLSGFEEWFFIGRPNVSLSPRGIVIRQREKPDLRFRGAAGTLVLERRGHIEQVGRGGSDRTTVTERARLIFRPVRAMDTTSAVNTYAAVQDLFILLTDSEFPMATPQVKLHRGQTANFYFGRSNQTETDADLHRGVAHFPAIETSFGSIFFSWLEIRGKIGAGTYLYLATRRGLDIYEEHRFLNLMTGLEAFHRNLVGDGDKTEYLQKVERILSQLDPGKDRRWLSKRLTNLGGPSLEKRVVALLGDVPAPLEQKVLKAFLILCARVRNQIAHEGRSADADASGQPLNWLASRSAILSRLYHAKLLLEIGLPRAMVERWLDTVSNFKMYLQITGIPSKRRSTSGSIQEGSLLGSMSSAASSGRTPKPAQSG